MSDPFPVEPDSSTDFALKSRLGIADLDQLQHAEAALTSSRLREIANGHGPRGQLNAA